jgi:hypothetical protein
VRACGSKEENLFLFVPSPSGLGYVFPRLRRYTTAIRNFLPKSVFEPPVPEFLTLIGPKSAASARQLGACQGYTAIEAP